MLITIISISSKMILLFTYFSAKLFLNELQKLSKLVPKIHISCIFSSHVLSEDTLQRRIVKPNQLHSLRVISKTNSMPKWGEKFMPGQKQMLVVEESVVDRKKQTLTTYTRNICMQSILVRNMMAEVVHTIHMCTLYRYHHVPIVV